LLRPSQPYIVAFLPSCRRGRAPHQPGRRRGPGPRPWRDAITPNTALRTYLHLIAWALRNAALRGFDATTREVAARVEELAQQLPQPATRPPPPSASEARASLLAGRLWDRYRDPLHAPDVSTSRRPDAMIIAATLDDEDVRWLAQQIILEFA